MLKLIPLIFLPFIFAFNFSPMSQTINLDDKKGTQFLIENESATNIAVELKVKNREMDDNGVETLTDTKDINIFPPQIIIPPKEKRTIRVTYSGPELKEEKAYRVIAEQLPLKVDQKTKDQAGITMLMQFVAALYATPAGAKSEVKLLSQESNGKEMKITIENKGNKHQLLNNPIIKFLNNGKKEEIKAADLEGMAGENVLANKKRIFKVKTTKFIPAGSKIELKVDD